MRIYTRTGDGGETSLFDGSRVHKDDARIEAYGTIDELNALVGGIADHPALNRKRKPCSTSRIICFASEACLPIRMGPARVSRGWRPQK